MRHNDAFSLSQCKELRRNGRLSGEMCEHRNQIALLCQVKYFFFFLQYLDNALLDQESSNMIMLF